MKFLNYVLQLVLQKHVKIILCFFYHGNNKIEKIYIKVHFSCINLTVVDFSVNKSVSCIFTYMYIWNT